MNKPIEMCCLCLTAANSLFIKLFSKSGDSSAFFDKVSISLPQLANVLNELGCKDYMVCTKCCDRIQLICEFNRTCIKNVRIFSSQREVLNVENPENIRFCVLKTQPLSNNTESKKREIIGDDAEKIWKEQGIGQGKMDVESVRIKQEDFIEVDELLLKNQHEIDNSEVLTAKGRIRKQSTENYTSALRANIQLNNEKDMKDNSSQLAARYMSTVFERSEEEQQGFSGHTKMVDKNTCHICNKTFGHTSYLNIHLRIHSGIKPFMCATCGRSFNHKCNLDAHMLTHTGEKPYKCDTCKKAFTTKQNLDSHKLIHSDEKPYLCELCHKQFRHKQGLVVHKRVHTGEKPHKCDLCDKAFISATHLNDHKRVHTGEKPFACHICTKEFTKRKSLKNHLLKH